MRTNANYVTAFLIVITLILVLPAPVQGNDREAEVRSTIEAFYKAFNDGFTRPGDYAAEDWNHINPFGGRTRGREAVLKEVREPPILPEGYDRQHGYSVCYFRRCGWDSGERGNWLHVPRWGQA